MRISGGSGVGSALIAIGAWLLIFVPALAQQPAPSAPSGKLTGRAAVERLIGNTMTGTSEGVPYFAFYDPEGAVRMQRGGEVSSGKWSIDGDNLCEEFPEDDDETCYHLEIEGDKGTMTDEDGTAYAIEILAGNPRKL